MLLPSTGGPTRSQPWSCPVPARDAPHSRVRRGGHHAACPCDVYRRQGLCRLARHSLARAGQGHRSDNARRAHPRVARIACTRRFPVSLASSIQKQDCSKGTPPRVCLFILNVQRRARTKSSSLGKNELACARNSDRLVDLGRDTGHAGCGLGGGNGANQRQCVLVGDRCGRVFRILEAKRMALASVAPKALAGFHVDPQVGVGIEVGCLLRVHNARERRG
jgi:hypothetical protein